MRDSKETNEIGYGKPPKEHQFRKGQSGNPHGRPKGSKSWKAIIQEELDRKIVVFENSKRKKITLKQALVRHAIRFGLTKNDYTLLRTIKAFEEQAPANEQRGDEEPWVATLIFDGEPQLTYQDGVVIKDHRLDRFPDQDWRESDHW